MNKQAFTIKWREWETLEWVDVPVEGYIAGDFAVIKNPNPEIPLQYEIAHVPTGRKVAYAQKVTEAYKAARAFDAIPGWADDSGANNRDRRNAALDAANGIEVYTWSWSTQSPRLLHTLRRVK